MLRNKLSTITQAHESDIEQKIPELVLKYAVPYEMDKNIDGIKQNVWKWRNNTLHCPNWMNTTDAIYWNVWDERKDHRDAEFMTTNFCHDVIAESGKTETMWARGKYRLQYIIGALSFSKYSTIRQQLWAKIGKITSLCSKIRLQLWESSQARGG